MRYQNARDILPEALIEELQKYAEGIYMYIPKKEASKMKWGEKNSAKEPTRRRNAAIYREYREGASRKELACRYCLSEKSSQRILTEKEREALETA